MSKPNLKNKVSEAILEDIYNGTYQAGDILNEKALIEKYQCSKSPVRDALVSLCADKILRSIPRYGYEVTKLTMDDIHEMLSFRFYLECGILKDKSQYFTEAQIHQLEELNVDCIRTDVTPRQHWEANVLFHKTLISFCGNSYIDEQLSECYDSLTRAYAQFQWGLGKKVLFKGSDCASHEHIIDALKHKDTNKLLEILKGTRLVWDTQIS